jgi:hypothetical protein
MEINSLVKNINDTITHHNSMIKDKELKHRENINRLENNKQDLIQRHDEASSDLKNTISNQTEQIAIQKIENENSELNLNNIKYEKQNELNNKI